MCKYIAVILIVVLALCGCKGEVTPNTVENKVQYFEEGDKVNIKVDKVMIYKNDDPDFAIEIPVEEYLSPDFDLSKYIDLEEEASDTLNNETITPSKPLE